MATLNKRLSLFLFFLIYVSAFANAQEKKTEPVSFLKESLDFILLSDYDKVQQSFALLNEDQKNKKAVQERLFLAKSLANYKNGEYDLAAEQLRQLTKTDLEELHLQKQLDQTTLYAWIALSKYYQTTGNNQLAEKILLIVYDIAKENNIAYIAPLSQYNLMNLYETIGEYPKALKIGLALLDGSQDHTSKIIRSGVYSQLGSSYFASSDTVQALDYHQKALTTREELGYTEGIAKSTRNVAYIYEKKGAFDKAIPLYNKSLDICKQLAYTKGEIKAVSGLGRIFLAQKKLKQAEQKLIRAFELSTDSGYEKGKIESIISLIEVYVFQKNYAKAHLQLNSALEMAIKADQIAEIAELYLLKSQLFEKEQRFDDALSAYKEYETYNTQLINIEKAQQIAHIETNYLIQQHQRENELLKETNAIQARYLSQNRILLIILSGLIILAIVVIFLFRSRNQIKEKALVQSQKAKAEIENKNEQLLLMSAEKDKLFGIISHELRNPLWWFRNLTEMLSINFYSLSKTEVEESLKTLQESANQAYHLTDNLLSWSKLQMKMIQPNLQKQSISAMLQQPLTLYASVIRFKNLQLKQDLEEEQLVLTDSKILTTIIRNLLSNAIKFAPKASAVQIHAFCADGALTLLIKNEGESIPKEIADWINSDNLSMPVPTHNQLSNGLGLMIAKELAKILDLELKFERIENNTNCFMLKNIKTLGE